MTRHRLILAALGAAVVALPAWADLTPSGVNPQPPVSVLSKGTGPGASQLNALTYQGESLLGPLNTQGDPSALKSSTFKHREHGGRFVPHQTVSDRKPPRKGPVLGETTPPVIPPPTPIETTTPGKPLPGEGTPEGDSTPFRSVPPDTRPIPAPGAALLASLGLSLVGWLKRRGV